jgi:hypothetical protein
LYCYFLDEVIDNKLQFDEAVWACRLHKSINKQRLHYQVAKELERRQKLAKEEPKVGCCSLKNGSISCPNCTRCQEGMVIDVITHEQPTACRGVCPDIMDDEDDITNTSPLTTSLADTTAAPSPSKDATGY